MATLRTGASCPRSVFCWLLSDTSTTFTMKSLGRAEQRSKRDCRELTRCEPANCPINEEKRKQFLRYLLRRGPFRLQINTKADSINEPPRWAITAPISLFEADQLRQETDVWPQSRLIKALEAMRHSHTPGPNETTGWFSQSLHDREHRRGVKHQRAERA